MRWNILRTVASAITNSWNYAGFEDMIEIAASPDELVNIIGQAQKTLPGNRMNSVFVAALVRAGDVGLHSPKTKDYERAYKEIGELNDAADDAGRVEIIGFGAGGVLGAIGAGVMSGDDSQDAIEILHHKAAQWPERVANTVRSVRVDWHAGVAEFTKALFAPSSASLRELYERDGAENIVVITTILQRAIKQRCAELLLESEPSYAAIMRHLPSGAITTGVNLEP